EVHVERIGMCHERSCRRSAGQRLQHRCLHLGEVSMVEGITECAHHRGTSTYRVAGLLPHYQIDITLPNSGFFRQLFVRPGKRSDGFRGELPLCGHDGKFTTLGSDDLPLDRNMLAEI